MKILNLRVSGFRNIQSVVLSEFGQKNIFWGENGQGKTNLLETLYVLVAGGSFRTRQDVEMIMDGEESAMVSGLVERGNGIKSQVAVRLVRELGRTKKELFIDDKKVSVGELVGKFPMVLFSPDEVDLVRNASQKRRKLIDGLGVVVDPQYRSDLFEYVRIWRHRNQLLLLVKQQRAGEEELDVWDERMAEVGARLVGARLELVARWGKLTTKKYQTFGQSKEGIDFDMKYLPNIPAISMSEYLSVLRETRRIDIIRTHTTRGIHRDDVSFGLGREDALMRSSRGEFRSIVLALKLAEGEILKEHFQETPVYLWDDVLSELDDGRRSALDEESADAQVFITTHEDISLGDWHAKVEQGGVREKAETLL